MTMDDVVYLLLGGGIFLIMSSYIAVLRKA